MIASLVLVSFKGGNLPYMLCFALLINTMTQIIYILYVYYTLKIYQVIPKRRVTKCEFVPYTLTLQNESLFAYRDIRLYLTKSLCEVKCAENLDCISLEPGQGINVDGELYCKYSGTYFVGVDTIEIMDYFKIFRIRFNMPQKMKVTVKPRILTMSGLIFVKDEEAFDSNHFGRKEYRLDNEVRKYYPGDNRRHIHWKNSAKRQELMVRTQMPEEVSEYVVVMDASMKKMPEEEKIICCDKLREATLGIVNYIFTSGYHVYTLLNGVNAREIISHRAFGELFDSLIDYGFGSGNQIQKNLENSLAIYPPQIPIVFVTSRASLVTKELLQRIGESHRIHPINVDHYETVEDLFQSEN